MKDADLFTGRPRREPLTVAHSRVVPLGGRAELRLLLVETLTPDGDVDRKLMLGRSWQDDIVIDVPALFVPAECVPALVVALNELVGEK